MYSLYNNLLIEHVITSIKLPLWYLLLNYHPI